MHEIDRHANSLTYETVDSAANYSCGICVSWRPGARGLRGEVRAQSAHAPQFPAVTPKLGMR